MKKILIGLLSLLIVTGCGCGKKNIDNIDQELFPVIVQNEQLLKEETIEVFEIKNTEIVYDGDITKFTSNITNLTAEEQSLNWLKMHITYVDNNDIERTSEILISIGGSLNPNETITTTTKVGTDLRNTKNVSYEIIK